MKFLHIADVHLGCTRYQLAESPRDFFDAWIDVIRRYAIGENVDFVIMCGDFFHKRSVPPETMNYAVEGLTELKNAGIPVVTIAENRRAGAFHILMLHTDVEGHQTHPIPALSLDALNELKSVTDYVGLGHTHKHYEIDNWAFNPGSIEITNISEFRETRGVFLVEIDDQNQVSARHIEEYHYRPFQQLA